MELDEKKIRDDIFAIVRYIMRHEKASSMQAIDEYKTFTQLYKELTGVEFVADFYLDKDRMQALYDKYDATSSKKVGVFTVSYLDDLRRLSASINDSYQDYIDYYFKIACSKFNKSLKLFSEKDFKDIVLSFYSEYGNDTYRLAKKYFEESKIGIDVWTKYSSAYYASSVIANAGYVALDESKLSTYALVDAVHELGHAFDYERLYLNQWKKLSVVEDLLLETPSFFFELSFYEYMMKHHIESHVGELLLNDNILVNNERMNKYQGLKIDEHYIDIDCYLQNQDGTIDYPVRDDIIYFLGMSLGINMLIRSREDKKGFIKDLNNYLCLRKERNFRQSVESLGISYSDFIEGKHLLPYIQETQKRLILKTTK